MLHPSGLEPRIYAFGGLGLRILQSSFTKAVRGSRPFSLSKVLLKETGGGFLQKRAMRAESASL